MHCARRECAQGKRLSYSMIWFFFISKTLREDLSYPIFRLELIMAASSNYCEGTYCEELGEVIILLCGILFLKITFIK